jgi:hypothetical protein
VTIWNLCIIVGVIPVYAYWLVYPVLLGPEGMFGPLVEVEPFPCDPALELHVIHTEAEDGSTNVMPQLAGLKFHFA